MVWCMQKEMLEDCSIIGGLIAVQFVYAGNSVLLSYLMSLGLAPLTIVIFSTFATFLVISPLAVYFERSKWPKKLGLKLMIQLALISFGGVTLFQSLFLKGIKLTSPALATAMPNLAPGLIFVIAWALRLEKVELSCIYSKVKLVGTLLCVVGALTMSLMHSTTSGRLTSPIPEMMFDKDKIIGCLYLMAAVIVLSSNVVLQIEFGIHFMFARSIHHLTPSISLSQATTLRDFPAPMSLCAITSFIGVIMTAIIKLIQDRTFDFGWSVVRLGDLIGYSILGGTVGGACVSFNGWAMKKRGPVLVSMFSPIGTVITVILSVVSLGDTVKIGSLAGMFIMFTGLYFVLWAKGKEGYLYEDAMESDFDSKKPLLS